METHPIEAAVDFLAPVLWTLGIGAAVLLAAGLAVRFLTNKPVADHADHLTVRHRGIDGVRVHRTPTSTLRDALRIYGPSIGTVRPTASHGESERYGRFVVATCRGDGIANDVAGSDDPDEAVRMVIEADHPNSKVRLAERRRIIEARDQLWHPNASTAQRETPSHRRLVGVTEGDGHA